MADGGFIPWDDWQNIKPKRYCICCMGVHGMPDREEMETIVSAQLEEELFSDKDLKLIRTMLEKDNGKEKVQKLMEKLAKGGGKE